MKFLVLLACAFTLNYACTVDNECPDGCCLGVGELKFCKAYTKEGGGCIMSSKVGCGCTPGLECKSTGIISKTCVKVACKTSADCIGGCCQQDGFCKAYQREGDECPVGCGCNRGLTCVKTGPNIKRCARVEKECGKPTSQGIRVIGGETAVRGSWPWQSLLKFYRFASCGGTLIAPQWVITAAHCVTGGYPQFSITVGEYDRSKKEGSEHTIGLQKIFRHPDYNHRTIENDIALVKLRIPVQFNKYVSPACLPTVDPPVGTNCYITGWGKAQHPGKMVEVLQQGKMAVVSNKVCNAKNFPKLGVEIKDSMICAGDGGKTRLSGCHGDSGGPFVCNINGRWEVHGAVSHGPPNCESSVAYTVFSRVHYFMDWIYDTMSRN